jgi:hypothetical protein
MPKPPCTDPAILAQRLERRRARGRVNTANYRARVNEKVNALMGKALEVMSDPQDAVDRSALRSPAISKREDRTVRAILRRTLRRNALTLDKAAARIAEALDSEKFRLLGEEVRSLPDFGNRLRATDMLLRLLERAGSLPSDKEAQTPQEITVNILMTNSASGKPEHVPLVAKVIDAVKAPTKAPIEHAGSSRDQALQNSRIEYEPEQSGT